MKVRLKITLCMLSILSLLFGIGGSLLISESFRDTLEREKDTAVSFCRMVWSSLKVVNGLDPYLNPEGITGIMEQLLEQNRSAWAALRLCAGDELLFETSNARDCFPPDLETPQTDRCSFRITGGKEGERYFILTGAVETGEDVTLFLYTAHDISGIYYARNRQQETYLRVFGVMIFLCAGLSYLTSRALTAPLGRLSTVSRAIASGDYSSRVRITSNDEIGAVSADFNAMAEQMEKTVLELRRSVDRQERFVGSFAHEMKTPMTSLIGYAELLRSGTLTMEEQTEAAGYIYSEGKRLESLSRKLLELLVIQQSPLPLVSIDPVGMLEEFVERLRPVYAREGIVLSLTAPAAGETRLLEPDLIWTLLLNLTDNARKAMEQGGSIRYLLELPEDGCRITVTDTGRGIPPEALAHLTEAFYRVDKARSREQGGFGLGLALCQEIVKFHHGTIRFANRPEGGADVIVELKGGCP